jgi:hypothetical protein
MGAVLGGMVYEKYDGGVLFLGIGLINLALGTFFTTLKLRYAGNPSSTNEQVAYVRLESAYMPAATTPTTRT